MSKGNMLLGFARGSVGDLTFYRRNAQQITRARSRVVKNPKTLAQQMQRAIMRTAVEAYKVLKEICDHSWEGISYGANSYAEFLKKNLAMLRSEAATGAENTKSYLPAGFSGLVAMPWILSKGSIAWNGYRDEEEDGGTRLVFNGVFTFTGEPQFAGLTYKAFADKNGLREGDQITFIWVTQRQDIDEAEGTELGIARIILSPGQGEFAETDLFDANGRINDGNPLNENQTALRFGFNGLNQTQARVLVMQGLNFDDNCICKAIIISRKSSDGSWLRSNATSIVDESLRDGGYTLRQASMVASTEIVTPSDWYLNNANESSGE